MGFRIQDVGDSTGQGPLCVMLVDTSGNYVAAGGSTGGGTPQSAIVYTANTGGTGYSAGDNLARITTVTGPSTAVSYWANQTQNTILSTAPTLANLTLISQGIGTLTNPNIVVLRDGASNNEATVSQFHNADNQQPGSTAYGLLTGGVAQLLNAVGNLDRQTETAMDGVTNRGIATGAQQMASPFATTSTTTISAAATTATITVAAASGANRGAPWAIKIGHILFLGATFDPAYVTAVSGTSITIASQTGGFLAHSGSYAVAGSVYNQARDASIADGSLGTGIGASATELFNQISNAGSGGWEAERSAAGELDGASGTGTAVAAGYEYNGGGAANTNNYDRERNVQGKGVQASTLSATATSPTSTFSFAAVTGLYPGAPIYLEYGTGNAETLYVSQSYTPGTLTVTTQSNSTITHTSGAAVTWDVYASQGPGLNGILPTGIGIEEDVVYDPASKKFYLEISATADGMSGQNTPMESVALWNGTTMDRLTGSAANGLYATLKYGGAVLSAANLLPVQAGGKATQVAVTPTISTTAYTAGFVVGGLLTFANAFTANLTGYVQSIKLVCKSIQTAGFKLYLFKTNPTNSTWTDHAAPAINAADLPFLEGPFPLSVADSGLGTETTYRLDGIGALIAGSTTSLYGILVTTGTPTFVSTSDITVTVAIDQN